MGEQIGEDGAVRLGVARRGDSGVLVGDIGAGISAGSGERGQVGGGALWPPGGGWRVD